MAPYSQDLRTRVLRDADAGLSSKDIAAKYAVSRPWVDRVKQRRREHGEVAPRRQTVFRHRVLTPTDENRLVALITARPEVTLVELRAALPTTAVLSTLWRTIRRLGFTVKKRYTPTSNGGRTSPRPGGSGTRGNRTGTRGASTLSMNPASPPI